MSADLDAGRRPRVLAFTLMALLPELKDMSRKQIRRPGQFFAPYDFDSGKLRGHRSIYGGGGRPRNVL